jgi:hypothetical protein
VGGDALSPRPATYRRRHSTADEQARILQLRARFVPPDYRKERSLATHLPQVAPDLLGLE